VAHFLRHCPDICIGGLMKGANNSLSINGESSSRSQDMCKCNVIKSPPKSHHKRLGILMMMMSLSCYIVVI
jgi:hypothetical protein